MKDLLAILLLLALLVALVVTMKGNPPDLESYEHHFSGGRVK